MTTAHVTKRFAYFLADQVFESLSEADPSRIYTFVGRPGPYANDAVTATPINDTQNNDYNIYKQMLAAKKLATTDITYASTGTFNINFKVRDNNYNDTDVCDEETVSVVVS